MVIKHIPIILQWHKYKQSRLAFSVRREILNIKLLKLIQWLNCRLQKLYNGILRIRYFDYFLDCLLILTALQRRRPNTQHLWNWNKQCCDELQTDEKLRPIIECGEDVPVLLPLLERWMANWVFRTAYQFAVYPT